ncbi:LysR family transcriptional regulator [Labrenzia sp. PHM005]|uniref:LysR family transcriptional regulator n=1 Tax=Labrenzia sp. PHM005 TaxID=2590016 RepID=UPI00113FF7B3|nr:LysR family transcriptional regulator [Labrenzia sp. PHM005]QDG76938.1 LysR family transcriptional regulator [Labrenzia sp. PHM005]
MDRYIDAEVFAAVAEAGSFSKAAVVLGLSKSAISRRISGLEARLSVRLMERTTRHLRLTEAGQQYLAKVSPALAQIEEAETIAERHSSVVRGHLKVLVPMAFGRLHVAKHLPDLFKLYPELTIDLILDDRKVNPHDLGCDLAFQAGDLPDSSLICRKLAPLSGMICAAPDYLESHPDIIVPADLLDHNCLLYSYSDNRDKWYFKSELGSEEIAVSGNYQINNGEAICEAAALGLGVARVATFVAAPYLANGTLVQVLKGYEMPEKAVYAVHSSRTLTPKKVLVFINFFAELYGPGRPYWEAALTGNS